MLLDIDVISYENRYWEKTGDYRRRKLDAKGYLVYWESAEDYINYFIDSHPVELGFCKGAAEWTSYIVNVCDMDGRLLLSASVNQMKNE